MCNKHVHLLKLCEKFIDPVDISWDIKLRVIFCKSKLFVTVSVGASNWWRISSILEYLLYNY